MLTYEPLFEELKKRDMSFYDLEHETGISHGPIYNLCQSRTVSLPVLNFIMYDLKLDSLDDLLAYYREGEQLPPQGVKTLISVDEFFKKMYQGKK